MLDNLSLGTNESQAGHSLNVPLLEANGGDSKWVTPDVEKDRDCSRNCVTSNNPKKGDIC